MQEEFGEKGLVVLALSSEPAETVAPYLDELGVTLRVGTGSNGSSAYGVTGIPNCVLIDANGDVVFQGHPSSLSNKTVKEALKGAIKSSGSPLSYNPSATFETKEVGKLVDLAREGSLAKAHKGATELVESGEGAAKTEAEELISELDAFVEELNGQATGFLERRDVLPALTVLKSLASEFKGSDTGTAATDKLAEIEKDEALSAEIEAAEALGKAQAEVVKRGKKKAVKKFEAIIKKWPDSRAAERARSILRG